MLTFFLKLMISGLSERHLDVNVKALATEVIQIGWSYYDNDFFGQTTFNDQVSSSWMFVGENVTLSKYARISDGPFCTI